MNALVLLCVALPAVFARGPSEFIVGGVAAGEGEWPWQLELQLTNSLTCGACLVSPTWAVCAAHCVGSAPAVYDILAGTNTRDSCTGQCQARQVTAVNAHPDFVNSGAVGFPNDVSTITWSAPINEVANRIQYVRMSADTGHVGRTCYITGWGRTSGGGALPLQLQEALIDILTTAECEGYWSAVQVSDNHICVYDRATQARGACNGDSGGPLVCQVGAAWELAGATSWGANGCSTTLPSVYTRISSYRDWVLGFTGPLP